MLPDRQRTTKCAPSTAAHHGAPAGLELQTRRELQLSGRLGGDRPHEDRRRDRADADVADMIHHVQQVERVDADGHGETGVDVIPRI